MQDFEIANKVELKKITEVLSNFDIDIEEDVELYGKYKAKIEVKNFEDKERKSKLVLVTATTPTRAGEGKTTVSVGLSDALNKIGKKTVLALREPSLGPVFGMKGGACGGGFSQLAPMLDINLNFTGDFSAITSANNLIAAHIDNNFWFGNELNLDPEKISWYRCLDANDRALKNIEIINNRYKRIEKFEITPASEIMAVFCLAKNVEDLKSRISRIVIGKTFDDNEVTVSDLNIVDSIVTLLLDALKPNVVQTLEHNLAILHGGPFANIAHGCNSIIATDLALKLGEYTVTEAGFASDLGAEKFFDIKAREADLKVDCVVIVTTIRSLKANGNVEFSELSNENVDATISGLENLKEHIRIVSNFTNNFVVTLNSFVTDTENEIRVVQEFAKQYGVTLVVNNVWEKGGDGGIDLAQEVVKICENNSENRYTYNLNDSIEEKIRKISLNVYGAKDVQFTPEVINKLSKLNRQDYYVVMAKTHMSLSDDKELINAPKDFDIHVKDILVKEGSNFIVVYTGNIITMPGLPKISNATKIKIVDDVIEGIF